MYYQRVLLGAAGYLNPAVHQAPQSCFELRLISSLTILLGLGEESSLEALSGGSKTNNITGRKRCSDRRTVQSANFPHIWWQRWDFDFTKRRGNCTTSHHREVYRERTSNCDKKKLPRKRSNLQQEERLKKKESELPKKPKNLPTSTHPLGIFVVFV